MPSRAETRIRVEQILRGIVIATLAVLLWQSLSEHRDSGGQTVNTRGLRPGALFDWSRAAKAPTRIHLRLDSVPSKTERTWLAALAGAGSNMTWSGDLAPTMIDVQPVPSPAGGNRVVIAAPSGSSIVLSDDVGAIDTVRAQNSGATITLNSIAGNLRASVNGSAASTVPRDSVAIHRILVIGDAGWESKFVVAALEEEGWKVDADIRIAPGVDVTQGSAASIDTSRYSVVVALDAAASPYANRIIEFARNGGGVVLAPQAASLEAMAILRAGNGGRTPSDARANQPGESTSLATLALAPITSLRSDAVATDKRAGAVAIAARRIGAGRVLQLGYEDTWRWRMGGGDGAVRDHRTWWTGLVSSVAYAPLAEHLEVVKSTDEAPRLGLVAAAGAATSESAMLNLPVEGSDWTAWLFGLLVVGLVGEVASRRWRGAA